ncbi:MAG: mechanosensitive ion channel [Betaproteobacteria bacterium]|nr:mechanosensitive ion channel [Betaproteobacteria bacterium]
MNLPPIIQGVWADFQSPAVLWQILILVFCLGIGFWLGRHFRRYLQASKEDAEARDHGTWRFAQDSVAGAVIPASLLLLILVLRPVLALWHPVHLLDLCLPLLLSLALVRIAVYMLACAFPNARWLAASRRWIAMLVWGCVVLYIVGLGPVIVDALEKVSFSFGAQRLNLWILLHGAATALTTILFALWGAGMIERRLLAVGTIDSSVRIFLGRALKALMLLIAILLSMSLVGIDVTALSVFSGALAVGLGLGLQKIASNYVSGMILLLDRSIRIGDLVALDPARNISGTVTIITTRYTVLRALGGIEYIVPNEHIVSNVIQNQCYTSSSVRVATSVQVGYSSDLDQVLALMVSAAQKQPRVLESPAPSALVLNFADSGIELEVGFWIADPNNGTRGLRSAVNLEIWRLFKEHGIEIPFPQREVRILNHPAASGG